METTVRSASQQHTPGTCGTCCHDATVHYVRCGVNECACRSADFRWPPADYGTVDALLGALEELFGDGGALQRLHDHGLEGWMSQARRAIAQARGQ